MAIPLSALKGVDDVPGVVFTASQAQADLARDMWERYKSAYLPVMENLSSDLMSGARLQESLAQVPEMTSQAFDLQQANQAARMQRMGLSGEQSETSKLQTDLSKVKAQATAENELRKFHEDMKRNAIMGTGGAAGSVGV